jgi:hypothetical protein
MKKKPKRRGRPKLPKGNAKASVLTVRLQPEQRKIVAAAARESGMTLSDWVRDILLSFAGEITIDDARTEGVGIEPPSASTLDPRDAKTR